MTKETTMSFFEKHVGRIENWCGAKIGVSATHIPSMQQINYNADEQFLLCSTYKIPIVTCILKMHEAQQVDLAELIEVHDYDLRLGMVCTLNQLNYSTPVKFSILNLIQFTLQESCNSATDLLLKRIGGPAVVMKMLANYGIESLRVDRYTLESLADEDGIREFIPSNLHCTLEQYKLLLNNSPKEQLSQIRAALFAQLLDHGSPNGVNHLLQKIVQNEILNENSVEILYKIMQRCKTGPSRIMGILPPNTRVSHKTGSLNGYFVHDAGIIHLSDDPQNKITLAIFTKSDNKPVAITERAIADIARTVFDYFQSLF